MELIKQERVDKKYKFLLLTFYLCELTICSFFPLLELNRDNLAKAEWIEEKKLAKQLKDSVSAIRLNRTKFLIFLKFYLGKIFKIFRS